MERLLRRFFLQEVVVGSEGSVDVGSDVSVDDGSGVSVDDGWDVSVDDGSGVSVELGSSPPPLLRSRADKRALTFSSPSCLSEP